MLEWIFLTASVVVLFYWGWALLWGLYFLRVTPKLHGIPESDLDSIPWPEVEILVAARNEEDEIKEAVSSLLKMDYPVYKVTVINDRSTDTTGTILENLQRNFSDRLKTVTVNELPTGWLGKNHALHMGSQAVSAPWILFTDADIKFHPQALKRAMALAHLTTADHIALTPRLEGSNLLLRAVHCTFALAFSLTVQPARANNSKSRKFVGIGAFNLVNTEVYHSVGGHRAISLRPDEDLRLGQLIKQRGYKQIFGSARDHLHLQWYKSLTATAVGLEKNAFAGLDYSLKRALTVFTVSPFLIWTPLLGSIFFIGWPQVFSFLALISLFTLVGIQGHQMKHNGLMSILLFPLSSAILGLIIMRSIALALWRQGIQWRGQFHPLKELKSQTMNSK